MTLFGHRVIVDIISEDEALAVVPDLIDWCPYKNVNIWAQRHMDMEQAEVR